MRNFYTADPDDKVIDQDLNTITDEEGDALLDEAVTTVNVWGNEELTAGLFLDLEFTTTVRYTSFDIDLYHGGNKYVTKEMSVTDLSFASDLSVDVASITLSNVNLDMSAILLNNDELGSKATISIGAVSASRRIYDLEPIIVANLTGWDANEVTAELKYSGLMAKWSKKTMRTAQSSCPWPIGGTECAYSGSETCSQTWVRCKQLSNQLNFGGFPWLPDLMEKKLYWGYLPPP